MWDPKYQISQVLLRAIHQIGEVVGIIKAVALPKQVFDTLQYQARELSTFASTSIEGNPLPLTDVKLLLKTSPKRLRDTQKEIINYNNALDFVYSKVKNNQFQLTVELLEKVQSIVVDGLMDDESDIGKIRTKPVIIRDPRRPDLITFIPPDVQDTLKLTEQLCEFITTNLTEIDPIILAGLFHRQFVVIHPFMDGNGRTTRIITTAILGMMGVDVFEIFSFENYYNQNVSRYFEKVGLKGDYYDHEKIGVDFSNWLDYFAEGILDELKRVQKAIPQIQEKPPLPDHYKLVIDHISKNGSINQKEYGQISKRSLAARKQDFSKIKAMGLITQKAQGKNTYYTR